MKTMRDALINGRDSSADLKDIEDGGMRVVCDVKVSDVDAKERG